MKIIQFLKKFPNESACKKHFKMYRDKESVVCKKCQNNTHYWLSTISQYKCKSCGFRTTLKSGTIMEHSHLPFQYWYIAMCLLTTTKKSFSALELQNQLGHKYYEPIWDMCHKIRRAMGERDSKYKLKGEIEVDEGFYEVVKTKEEREDEKKRLFQTKQKRGKGSDKQHPVLVMVDSKPTNNFDKYKPSKKVSFIKMIALDGITASDIDYEMKKAIDKNSIITSDDATYYENIKKNFKGHNALNLSKSPSDTIFKRLPWVHKVISNSKRNFLGLHHSIGRKYIQNYLNEFCWKFNRRYKEDLFDRMITTSVSIGY